MSHQQILQHLSNIHKQPPTVIESIVPMLTLCTRYFVQSAYLYTSSLLFRTIFLLEQNVIQIGH